MFVRALLQLIVSGFYKNGRDESHGMLDVYGGQTISAKVHSVITDNL